MIINSLICLLILRYYYYMCSTISISLNCYQLKIYCAIYMLLKEKINTINWLSNNVLNAFKDSFKNFQYKLKSANQAHPQSWNENVFVPTLKNFWYRSEVLSLCRNRCFKDMSKMKRWKVNMNEWSAFH